MEGPNKRLKSRDPSEVSRFEMARLYFSIANRTAAGQQIKAVLDDLHNLRLSDPAFEKAYVNHYLTSSLEKHLKMLQAVVENVHTSEDHLLASLDSVENYYNSVITEVEKWEAAAVAHSARAKPLHELYQAFEGPRDLELDPEQENIHERAANAARRDIIDARFYEEIVHAAGPGGGDRTEDDSE